MNHPYIPTAQYLTGPDKNSEKIGRRGLLHLNRGGLSTHGGIRREYRRPFHVGFKSFERGADNLPAQARIELLREIGVAAWMRNTYAFDNPIGTHLLRHWKHRTD